MARHSVRGGVTALASQGFTFVAQTASTIILARLLQPEDFGLTAMVAAITGCLTMFGDLGLGAATIQREKVSQSELSTLFWLNVAFGLALTLIAIGLSPFLVRFYQEPRLYRIMLVSSLSLVLGGIGAQHAALLLRSMDYRSLAIIRVLSLALSSGTGIAMAFFGFGYWSLVAMTVGNSLVRALGYWIACGWRPGLPVRDSGIRSMVRFGGTVTLNSLVVYVSYNIEKVLLGRSFGAEALGIYSRAYQLLNLPLQQLHGSLYNVAFPALSSIKGGDDRRNQAFLKGYSVLLALTVPLIMASALFAEDIVRLLLGAQWGQAVPIVRILTPTILAFAMINPFGWFLLAVGRADRSLAMAFVIAPVVVLGILCGLPWGPSGVAIGYSSAMGALLPVLIVWAIHDTGITVAQYWSSAQTPLVSGLVASICGFACRWTLAGRIPDIPLFALAMTLSMTVFTLTLLFVMGQRDVYFELARHVLKSRT